MYTLLYTREVIKCIYYYILGGVAKCIYYYILGGVTKYI